MPILVTFLDGTNHSAANVDRFPAVCPRCNERTAPRFVAATVQAGRSREICFQCTNGGCRGLFLGVYLEEGAATYRFVNCERGLALWDASSHELKDVSPSFVKLFNEALAAEAVGLGQLFKLGLCSAFQRLVRDFCKFENNTESDAIEQMPFADCVARYVVEHGLGNWLRRASPGIVEPLAWTEHLLDGNDERLKGLVRLTMNYVEGTLLSRRLTNDASVNR